MITISDHHLDILKEFQRRQSHAINVYQPSHETQHDQLSYHKSLARVRLLFGGNQSGKSHAAADDCARHALGENLYTGINITGRDVEIWVISVLYQTIKTGIYRHLKNIIPDWRIIHSGAKIVGTDLPSHLKVKRKDGFITTISFMSAKGDDESRGKFQSAAIDYFYIDEEIQGTIWEELQARTLATAGRFSISATLIESYDWITKLELQSESDPDIFVTRLNTELNPYLDKKTVELLKRTWSQETLEYRFYGKSRRVQGIIYNTWDDARHVIPPQSIPKDWPRWRAIDPGIRVCAVLWCTCTPEGRIIAYREMYATNEPLWQVALAIKQCEGWELDRELSYKFNHYVYKETDRSETMVCALIDPKARARSEAGEVSILDQLYTRYGLVCQEADNSMRPGIEDCRFALENMGDGLPKFQIFNTLYHFQDERRVYRYRSAKARKESADPIDDPIRKKNHLMDCWRYIMREQPKFSDRMRLPEFQDVQKHISPHEILAGKKDTVMVHDELGSEW